MESRTKVTISDEEVKDLLMLQGFLPDEMTREVINAYRQSLLTQLNP